jgi:integrase
MSLKKRGKTWHTDFAVNGERFRQSLDTTDWREAQSKEKELIAQASEGKLTPSRHDFARLGFSEAANRYLDSRKLELSASSLKKERQLLVQPRQFYGLTPLRTIANENLLPQYREQRAQKVGPVIINMEVGVIRRILKKAKLWHLVAGEIRPLKERHRVGRALLEAEKLRLLKIASSRPEWQGAYCAAILALNTTMRGCEIKGLRWSDISLLERTVTVYRSKTDAGERVIPLNQDAMSAVMMLYRRAQESGATEPTHHVFPACENGNIDASRPQVSWRTAWRNLTSVFSVQPAGLFRSLEIIVGRRSAMLISIGPKARLLGCGSTIFVTMQ